MTDTDTNVFDLSNRDLSKFGDEDQQSEINNQSVIKTDNDIFSIKIDHEPVFTLTGLPDNIKALIDDLDGFSTDQIIIEKHHHLMTHLPDEYRHMVLCQTLPAFSNHTYRISREASLSLMLHGTEDYMAVINHSEDFSKETGPLNHDELTLRFSLIKCFLELSHPDCFKMDYYERLIALILHGMSIEQINSGTKILQQHYLLYSLLYNDDLHPFIAIFEKYGLDVRHVNGENSLLAFLDKYHKTQKNLQLAIEYLVCLDIALVEENSRFYTFFDYIFFSWFCIVTYLSDTPVFLCSHEFFDVTRRRYNYSQQKNEDDKWPSRVVDGENILFKIRDCNYSYYKAFNDTKKLASSAIFKEINNSSLKTDLTNFDFKHVFDQTGESITLWYLTQHVDTGAHIQRDNEVKFFTTLGKVPAKNSADKIIFYNAFFSLFFEFSQYCYHFLKQSELGPVKPSRKLNFFENAFFYYLKNNEPFTQEFLEHFEKQYITKPEEPVVVNDDEIHGELFSEATQTNFENYVKNVGDGNGSSFENSKNFIKRIKTDKTIRNKTFAKSSVLLEKIANLYHEFPHFNEVIEHIENHCVLQNQGSGAFYVPPLLLAGGPGIGKTFFCHTISELVDTPMHVFNMESMTGNFAMTGLSEAWGNAAPGMIFNVLANKHRINPIFIFDELDKAKGDERFSPTNSLLPLLERYTAQSFKDECIQIELDASHSIWIATANTLDTLSAPLKSRFDIYNVPNPNWHQRRNLVQGIYQSLLKNNSWGASLETKLSETVLDVLADAMGPGAARDLRRSITTACAKAARHQRKEITLADLPAFHQQHKMPWDTSLNFENKESV